MPSVGATGLFELVKCVVGCLLEVTATLLLLALLVGLFFASVVLPFALFVGFLQALPHLQPSTPINFCLLPSLCHEVHLNPVLTVLGFGASCFGLATAVTMVCLVCSDGQASLSEGASGADGWRSAVRAALWLGVGATYLVKAIGLVCKTFCECLAMLLMCLFYVISLSAPIWTTGLLVFLACGQHGFSRFLCGWFACSAAGSGVLCLGQLSQEAKQAGGCSQLTAPTVMWVMSVSYIWHWADVSFLLLPACALPLICCVGSLRQEFATEFAKFPDRVPEMELKIPSLLAFAYFLQVAAGVLMLAPLLFAPCLFALLAFEGPPWRECWFQMQLLQGAACVVLPFFFHIWLGFCIYALGILVWRLKNNWKEISDRMHEAPKDHWGVLKRNWALLTYVCEAATGYIEVMLAGAALPFLLFGLLSCWRVPSLVREIFKSPDLAGVGKLSVLAFWETAMDGLCFIFCGGALGIPVLLGGGCLQHGLNELHRGQQALAWLPLLWLGATLLLAVPLQLYQFLPAACSEARKQEGTLHDDRELEAQPFESNNKGYQKIGEKPEDAKSDVRCMLMQLATWSMGTYLAAWFLLLFLPLLLLSLLAVWRTRDFCSQLRDAKSLPTLNESLWSAACISISAPLTVLLDLLCAVLACLVLVAPLGATACVWLYMLMEVPLTAPLSHGWKAAAGYLTIAFAALCCLPALGAAFVAARGSTPGCIEGRSGLIKTSFTFLCAFVLHAVMGVFVIWALSLPVFVVVWTASTRRYLLAITTGASCVVSSVYAMRLVQQMWPDRETKTVAETMLTASMNGVMAWGLLLLAFFMWTVPMWLENTLIFHSHAGPALDSWVSLWWPGHVAWAPWGNQVAVVVADVAAVVLLGIIVFVAVREFKANKEALASFCGQGTPPLHENRDRLFSVWYASGCFAFGCVMLWLDFLLLWLPFLIVLLTVWRAWPMFKKLHGGHPGTPRNKVLTEFAKLMRDVPFLLLGFLGMPGVSVAIAAYQALGPLPARLEDSRVSLGLAMAVAIPVSIAGFTRFPRGLRAIRRRIRGWALPKEPIFELTGANLKFAADGRGYLVLQGTKRLACGRLSSAEISLLGQRPSEAAAQPPPLGAPGHVTLFWEDPIFQDLNLGTALQALRKLLPFRLATMMMDLRKLSSAEVGQHMEFEVHFGMLSHMARRDTLLEILGGFEENTLGLLQAQAEDAGEDVVLFSVPFSTGRVFVTVMEGSCLDPESPWGSKHGGAETLATNARTVLEEASASNVTADHPAPSSLKSSPRDEEAPLLANATPRDYCLAGEEGLEDWQDAVWRAVLRGFVAMLVDIWHLFLVCLLLLAPWRVVDLIKVFLRVPEYWPLRRMLRVLQPFTPGEDLSKQIAIFHQDVQAVHSECMKRELYFSIAEKADEERVEEQAVVTEYQMAVSEMGPYITYREAVNMVRTVCLYNDLTPWTSVDPFQVMLRLLETEYRFQFSTLCALHLHVLPEQWEKNEHWALAAARTEDYRDAQRDAVQKSIHELWDLQGPLREMFQAAEDQGLSWRHFRAYDGVTLRQMIREQCLSAMMDNLLVVVACVVVGTLVRALQMIKEVKAAKSGTWRKIVIYAHFAGLVHDGWMCVEFLVRSLLILVTLTEPGVYCFRCIDVLADKRRFKGRRIVSLRRLARNQTKVLKRRIRRFMSAIMLTLAEMCMQGWDFYRDLLSVLGVTMILPASCLELILKQFAPGCEDGALSGLSLLIWLGLIAWPIFGLPAAAELDSQGMFELARYTFLFVLGVLSVLGLVVVASDRSLYVYTGDETTHIAANLENIAALAGLASDLVQMCMVPFTLVTSMGSAMQDEVNDLLHQDKGLNTSHSAGGGPGMMKSLSAQLPHPDLGWLHEHLPSRNASFWHERIEEYKETSLGFLFEHAPALNFRFSYQENLFFLSVYGAIGLVILWMLVNAVPETLENWRQVVPPNTFSRRSWWQVLSKTLCSGAFIPIVTNLLKSFDCSAKVQDGEVVWHLEDAPGVACWVEEGYFSQRNLARLALLALASYIITCLTLKGNTMANQSPNADIRSSMVYEASMMAAKLIVAFCLHLNGKVMGPDLVLSLLAACCGVGVGMAIWTSAYSRIFGSTPCSSREVVYVRAGGYACLAWTSLCAGLMLLTDPRERWLRLTWMGGMAAVAVVVGFFILLMKCRKQQQRAEALRGLLELWTQQLQRALSKTKPLPLQGAELQEEATEKIKVEGESGEMGQFEAEWDFKPLKEAAEAGSMQKFAKAVLALEDRLEARRLPQAFVRRTMRWRALLFRMQMSTITLTELQLHGSGEAAEQDMTVPVLPTEADGKCLLSSFPHDILSRDRPNVDPAVLVVSVNLLAAPPTRLEEVSVQRGWQLVEPELAEHVMFKELWVNVSRQASLTHRFVFRSRLEAARRALKDLADAAEAGRALPEAVADKGAIDDCLNKSVAASTAGLVSIGAALASCLHEAGPRELGTDPDLKLPGLTEALLAELASKTTRNVAETLVSLSGNNQDTRGGDDPVGDETAIVRRLRNLETQEGELKLRGQSFPYSWSKVECRLKAAVLRWDKKNSKEQSANFASNAACRAELEPKRGIGCFQLIFPDRNALHFQAASLAQADAWVKALTSHIACAGALQSDPRLRMLQSRALTGTLDLSSTA